MDNIERAISQVADIHARLLASSRFRGFGPEAMVFTAILSLAVATAQTIWPHIFAPDALGYVAVWAAATGIWIFVSAAEAILRSRRLHGRMANAMLGSTLRLMLPFAAAGIVIGVTICQLSPSSAWMLPGLWQILIALSAFSMAPSLPRPIVWVAGWYFACGAVVFGLGARSGELSPWMMGLPLTLGQASVAFILHRAKGEADARS